MPLGHCSLSTHNQTTNLKEKYLNSHESAMYTCMGLRVSNSEQKLNVSASFNTCVNVC